MVRSPRLLFETTQGGLAPRVRQQVQALVYALNRELQAAYIEANVDYVELIREGGRGEGGRYAGRREELVTALERVYGALDSGETGPGPGDRTGLAA